MPFTVLITQWKDCVVRLLQWQIGWESRVRRKVEYGQHYWHPLKYTKIFCDSGCKISCIEAKKKSIDYISYTKMKWKAYTVYYTHKKKGTIMKWFFSSRISHLVSLCIFISTLLEIIECFRYLRALFDKFWL